MPVAPSPPARDENVSAQIRLHAATGRLRRWWQRASGGPTTRHTPPGPPVALGPPAPTRREACRFDASTCRAVEAGPGEARALPKAAPGSGLAVAPPGGPAPEAAALARPAQGARRGCGVGAVPRVLLSSCWFPSPGPWDLP